LRCALPKFAVLSFSHTNSCAPTTAHQHIDTFYDLLHQASVVWCAGQAKRSSQHGSPNKIMKRHIVGHDAATQVSPLKACVSANAVLQNGEQVAGAPGPLRKRFGGFWENVNDPRSSYMSAATADTAVLTESAVTRETPEPSGSAQSSPHIRCCCWLPLELLLALTVLELMCTTVM
jgi:hypothetical protein